MTNIDSKNKTYKMAQEIVARNVRIQIQPVLEFLQLVPEDKNKIHNKALQEGQQLL